MYTETHTPPSPPQLPQNVARGFPRIALPPTLKALQLAMSGQRGPVRLGMQGKTVPACQKAVMITSGH